MNLTSIIFLKKRGFFPISRNNETESSHDSQIGH